MSVVLLLAALFFASSFAFLRNAEVSRTLMAVWLAFAAGLFSFAVSTGVPLLPAGAKLPLTIVGAASCGLSFLLARALFQPKDGVSGWPIMLVGVLFVSGAIVVISRYVQTPGEAGPTVVNMIGQVHGLVSSTVLLIALIEPLRGIRKAGDQAERRFRIAFTCVYTAMLAAGVIWARQVPETAQGEAVVRQIKIACVMLALFGGGAAVWFRGRHPIENPKSRSVLPENEENALAQKVLSVLSRRELIVDPEFRLADLARKVNAPAYRVTQVITGVLGYSNFNRLINERRLQIARSQFDDRQCDHLPVLTIALDCGFGSIGPFNRAFKEQTGMTPTAYRKQAQKEPSADEMTGLSA